MYLEHTKDYESPSAFWLWSAFASIAAVLRDNVWHSEGDSKLYPNIYVLFLANSGARKNRPVVMSELLVRACKNTKVISGRGSIQGILDELAHTETDARKGTIVRGGSAIFYAPELAAAIVGDQAAISILTDIYDGKTDFTSVLRNSPKFKIDQIVFSTLMASNEVMIKDFFDTRAAHGGMLARTLLVCPDEFRPRNSLWTDVEKAASMKANLVKVGEELYRISQMKGDFAFSEQARIKFDDWYIPFGTAIAKTGDPTGVNGRIHTSAKKVAMLLAANDLSNVVEEWHVTEALDKVLKLMPNYNLFAMGSGKSDIASKGALIVNDLMLAKGYRMSRTEIIARHWQDMGTSEEVDKIITTLDQGGIIKLEIGSGGQFCILTQRVIDKMKGVTPKNDK